MKASIKVSDKRGKFGYAYRAKDFASYDDLAKWLKKNNTKIIGDYFTLETFDYNGVGTIQEFKFRNQ